MIKIILIYLTALMFGALANARNLVEDSGRPVAELDPEAIHYSIKMDGFVNWLSQSPEGQALNLFPGYAERQFVAEDEYGIKKPQTEGLTVIVAKARFFVKKELTAETLAGLLKNLDYLKAIDPTFAHRQISVGDIVNYQEKKGADGRVIPNPILMHNNPQGFRWCENRPNSVCVESRFDYPSGLITKLITLKNTKTKVEHKLRGASGEPRLYHHHSLIQSELRLLNPAEAAAIRNVNVMTGSTAPLIGAIEQSMFHVNQISQFGKSLVIAQKLASDTTLITTYVAVGIKSKNIAGKQAGEFQAGGLNTGDFLMGKSIANNNDCTLFAGFPKYTQCVIKSAASFLDK